MTQHAARHIRAIGVTAGTINRVCTIHLLMTGQIAIHCYRGLIWFVVGMGGGGHGKTLHEEYNPQQCAQPCPVTFHNGFDTKPLACVPQW